MHHVCAMAIRYDERMSMILSQARYDSYQRDFIARAYKDEDYAKKKTKLLRKKTYVKFKPVVESARETSSAGTELTGR